MRRTVGALAVAFVLSCTAAGAGLGVLATAALGQDTATNPRLPNPAPPPGPDYVHLHVVYWICTVSLAALGGAGGTIKVMWSYQGAVAKDHVAAMAQQAKDHTAAMADLARTHAADCTARRDRHTQEIAALQARLDREQTERRQDAGAMHLQNVEVNKACMAALNAVTVALNKNTEQVTRLANGWVDGA